MNQNHQIPPFVRLGLIHGRIFECGKKPTLWHLFNVSLVNFLSQFPLKWFAGNHTGLITTMNLLIKSVIFSRFDLTFQWKNRNSFILTLMKSSCKEKSFRFLGITAIILRFTTVVAEIKWSLKWFNLLWSNRVLYN